MGKRAKVLGGRVGARDVIPYKKVAVAWVDDFITATPIDQSGCPPRFKASENFVRLLGVGATRYPACPPGIKPPEVRAV